MRGYAREGRQWLEQLLALEPSTQPSVRARALLSRGLTYWLSDVEATDRAYRAAVALYREIGDRNGEVEALYDFAYVPVMSGQLEESRARFEAAMALALELGRTDIVARSKVAGSPSTVPPFGDFRGWAAAPGGRRSRSSAAVATSSTCHGRWPPRQCPPHARPLP